MRTPRPVRANGQPLTIVDRVITMRAGFKREGEAVIRLILGDPFGRRTSGTSFAQSSPSNLCCPNPWQREWSRLT